MTTILPNFDPYIVLGVDKQSTPSEIKLAYRKLILKCHPDKIQDDALRAKASDEFQKVQESYEILTDDKRREQHDLAVRLAELRKKVNSQSSARAAANREYRDGYIYEERVPADAAFFTDSDEQRYTEEPPTYSKKYHDSAKRAHTKVAEEKKAKSVPLSSPRTPKQADREHVKSKNHDRAKHRTKERRRDVSDKYERTTSSFVYTGDDFSDSEDGSYYVKVTTEPRASPRESVPRRSKTEPHSSHRHRRHYIDSESEIEGEDYENDLNYAKEYITRSRDPIPEPERRYRSSRTHSSYDSPRYERESSRYSSRGYSRDEDIRHPASSPHRTSRRSHDRLSSPTRAYERSATTTSASPPKVSSSRAPPPVSRSSTAPHPRTRREGLSRSESNGMSTLTSMVAGIALESVIPSKTRSRAERNDSGYSSGPGTPEMTQGSSSAPKVSRFKIVEPSDREPETIIREPADARYRGTSPLPRSDRERSSRTKSSRSYVYDPVYDADIHTARPAAASKSSYSRPLYGEVRYSPDISIDGRRSSRRQAAY